MVMVMVGYGLLTHLVVFTLIYNVFTNFGIKRYIFYIFTCHSLKLPLMLPICTFTNKI